MRIATLVLLAILLSATSVQAGTVTGEIKQLDGQAIDRLQNFQVIAIAGGQILARGELTTKEAPFQYSISIDEKPLIARKDVRVALVFSATGRQTITVLGTAS